MLISVCVRACVCVCVTYICPSLYCMIYTLYCEMLSNSVLNVYDSPNATGYGIMGPVFNNAVKQYTHCVGNVSLRLWSKPIIGY